MIGILRLLIMEPEVWALLRTIYTDYQKYNKKIQVKKEVKAIHEAFKNKDAAALERVFNPSELRYNEIKD